MLAKAREPPPPPQKKKKKKKKKKKNIWHTRKQNLACLTFVSFQCNGCVLVILIINFFFGSVRLWPTSFNSNNVSVILGLSHVLPLVPSTLGVGEGRRVMCLRHSMAPHDRIKHKASI